MRRDGAASSPRGRSRATEAVAGSRLASPKRVGAEVAIIEAADERGRHHPPRASQLPYATILEGAAEAILIAEVATHRYRWVNPAACALLGYSRDELLGMRLHDLHPASALPAILAVFDTLEPDQRAEARAVPCLRRDRTVLLVDIRASTTVIDGAAYNIGFFTDVSEMHQLNRALQDSQRGLIEAQRTAGIGSWEWDARTGRTLRSDEMHRIYGVEPGTIPATPDAFLAFVHPDDRGRVEAVARAALASADGRHAFDFRAVRPDGSVRFLHDEARVVVGPDGRPASLVGTVQDVTDRVAAEAERARLIAAVEQTSDAVVITDLAGTIEYVNPAFEQMSGYRRDQAVGCNPRILKSGQQSDAFYEALWDHLTQGRNWAGRFINRRVDNSLYQVEATISPIRDGRGETTGYIGVQRDVTALHAARSSLANEFRERAQIAAALSRLQPRPSAAETAAEICRELASVPGVEVAAIVSFLDAEHATALGVVAPDGFPVATGQRLPAVRAAYLHERASLGPWAETYRPRAEDAEYGAAMEALGVRANAYAPIRNGEGLLGLVAAGTCDETYARHLVAQLPAVGEFAATAGALLARELEGDNRLTRLRTQIAGIIEGRAFHPVFQPIVDVDDGAVVGYEALTRFDDGTRPDHRFADAWAVDLGAELELATLEAAVALARGLPAGRWLDVNCSPMLLADPGRIRSVLTKADRPLVAEITEHDTVADYRALRESLRTLGDSVRTAVDDAGAGIANLAHIVEMRPDFVKLDLRLVRDVNADLSRQAMVIAMRHFARTTGCRLIAEGVETEAEARSLAALGVDFGQGYHYGRPEALAALLAMDRRTS